MLNKATLIGCLALMIAVPFPASGAAGPAAALDVSLPGIDYLYVDPAIGSFAESVDNRERLHQAFSDPLLDTSTADPAAHNAPNWWFAALAEAGDHYEAQWGSLPQLELPAGPTLKIGSTGERVGLLRIRLGLAPDGDYDQEVSARVAEYQRVHGLGTPDGMAGAATIRSLNFGSDHYLRKLAINLERARRLPASGVVGRYVVVDAGKAEAYLIDHDRVADNMRVVVGAPETKTPMLALLMRQAKANPYWNVPADMIRDTIAARVLRRGVGYLKQGNYEVLSDWTAAGVVLDPNDVDWKLVASGNTDVHVRQLPGPWNAMGEMKFEMPNRFGIYIHDTPNKDLFSKQNRWQSNGCVRLEDYRRFATWVFETPPQVGSQPEQTINLTKPVPVYITYFTVEPNGAGLVFRDDPYQLDPLASAGSMSSAPELIAAAS